jgi:hypothetical protein
MNVLGAEAVARAVYRALDGRHAADVAVHLGDASVLHVDGRSGFAGEYQGPDAILEVLARMADLTDGTLSYGSPEAVSEARGDVIVAGRVRARRGRRMLDTRAVVTIGVDTELLRDAWLRHPDQDAFDRFWT